MSKSQQIGAGSVTILLPAKRKWEANFDKIVRFILWSVTTAVAGQTCFILLFLTLNLFLQ